MIDESREWYRKEGGERESERERKREMGDLGN